jgi:hypothetical protein
MSKDSTAGIANFLDPGSPLWSIREHMYTVTYITPIRMWLVAPTA